ncbi:hypothetical protein I553_8954 [Mycobacterium xenopi 4042]|uniref:AMP-binding enzyme C-terminal domain-containing protein n=1 Tax=Mycobacterium xenopi 4042 TaxID=1299334 RepID=X8AMN5_MYCXE|nr:hypothetical protein I553_8954 [Mycobacterium xenopi 4042]
MTGTADPAEVRRQLAEQLPDYMVPAAVVVLDTLPRTPTGKLDKRALPTPEYADTDRYRPPSSPTEEILAGIYAQILGLARVGPTTRFSIWVGIRCRRCGWWPRSTLGWMPGCRCAQCSRRPPWPSWRPHRRRSCGSARAAAAGAAAGGGAVVVCPAAVVVFGAVARTLPDLHPGRGAAAVRAPGRRGARSSTGRCGGPPRKPAHRVSRRRRHAPAGGGGAGAGRLRLAKGRCRQLAGKPARPRHRRRGPAQF